MEFLRSLLEVVEAPQYESLNDAAVPDHALRRILAKGNIVIWYSKTATFRDFSLGVDFARKLGKLPTGINGVKRSHTILGKIKGPGGKIDNVSLETIFKTLQGEIWSPQGEARNLIKKSKTSHTSMSIGDIVQDGKRFFMVDKGGFDQII
jgi:hypothetical protein